MTDSRIGVIGCGWLGLPLAAELAAKGLFVKGSTTLSKKLAILNEQGIDSYLIRLTENIIEGDISGFLTDVDILIVNIPPALRRNPNSSYVKKMGLLSEAIQKSTIKKIMFISSTSVYGKQEGEITEETLPMPSTESGRQLLEAENLFRQLKRDTSIIRFGGLIGSNRHPVYHLSGKKGLKNGDELINLIHLDDCIHMIKTIIENNYWNQIFNGVYPYHPTKREYYEQEAVKRNLDKPNYGMPSEEILQKIVKSKNFLINSHSFLTSISL